MNRAVPIGTTIVAIGALVWLYAAYYRLNHAFDAHFRTYTGISAVTLMIGMTAVVLGYRAQWRHIPDKQAKLTKLGWVLALGWLSVGLVLYAAILGG